MVCNSLSEIYKLKTAHRLYYYGARYYDPKTSVFLGVDPLADKFPFINPYSYCFNNPVRLTDPFGLEPEGPEDPPTQTTKSLPMPANTIVGGGNLISGIEVIDKGPSGVQTLKGSNQGNPQGQGGERDWLDKTQIGMESYGLANSSKEQLIKYAAKTDPSINNLKYVKGVKAAGKVLVVAGAAATMYEAYDDAFNKGSYYSAGTRIAVAGVAIGAAFIPFVGWGIAGGIGIADAIWGDQFYNWVELNLRKEP